ncbi:MAG: 30S ribosomal protein S18 [Patescibacteria group bacterium]
MVQKEKSCAFCALDRKEIDYKDVTTLQRYISSYAKILPTKRTGTCARHQRKLATAIKRARQVSLLPTVGR